MRNPIDLTTLAAVKDWQDIDGNGSDADLQLCITAASRDILRRTGRGNANGINPTSPFNQQIEYTELLDGNGSGEIFPRNSPIISVSSLVVNGVALSPSLSFGQPGYFIDTAGRSLVIQGVIHNYGRYNSFGHNSRGRRNVALTYTAGYPAVTVNESVTFPIAPYVYAVKQAWLSDGGVTYVGGAALSLVSSAPATGQYAVDAFGNYTFAIGDKTASLFISYQAFGTPEDITQACIQIVSLNYKRQNWVGLSSEMQSGIGQTNYAKYDIPPEAQDVIIRYTRGSL